MKKHYKYILWGALLTTTACSDDYFDRNDDVKHSDYIGYEVNVTGNDQFLSRSGDNTPRSSHRLTIENTGLSIGGRPLYLHTEVVDSIPMSISRAKKDTIASRGTITTNPTDIGISAVVFDGDKNAWPNADKTAEAQMYMHNEKLTPPWQTNRYWPRENAWIRFYAYSPYGILGENGLPAISATEPSFSYTVDNDITKQQDLLVGSEQYEGGWCRIAPLDMSHALTAVRIHIDGNVSDFTLNSVTISGLKNHGTYTYEYNPENYSFDVNGNKTEAHDEGKWDNVDYDGEGTSASYNVFAGTRELNGTGGKDVNGKDNVTFDEEDVSDYVDATPGNMVLLMMPQELTPDAKITITGKDGVLNSDVTLSATIGDANKTKVWEKGKMYTYTLSFSSTKIEYTITAKATDDVENPDYTDNVDIPYYGIKDRGYKVVSYKTVTRSGLGSKTYAVPWVAVQIDAKGEEIELPAGLILSEPSGTGVDMENQTSEDYTYCMLPNIDDGSSSSHSTISKKEAIPANSPVLLSTKSQPYDLSTEALYDANVEPKNTANSYMIFAPGYYTLPLVYGNAITNRSNNTSAYTAWSPGNQTQKLQMTYFNGDTNGESVEVERKQLTQFIDHKGEAIKGPWIVPTERDYGPGPYSPKKVEIVWQDEPCLVSELDFNAEKDYITFRVHDDAVCDGNAVIAVKDENDVTMWSWHIWVNDGKTINATDERQMTQPYIYESTKEFSTIENTNRRIVSDKWEDSDWDKDPIANTFTGQKFSTFRVFLGHCDGESKIYNKRTITVRFKQVESDDAEFLGTPQYTDVIFQQGSGAATTVNNIPYYQYGRKDPMLPTGNGTNDKVWYDNDGKPQKGLMIAEGQGSLSDAIKNPQTFYRDPKTDRDQIVDLRNCNWCSDGTYTNLWNTNSWALPLFSSNNIYNSADKRYKYHNQFKELISCSVTKSVYDPCPPGYEMPRIDAFTGATYHGMNLYPLWYDGRTGDDVKYFAFSHENKKYEKYGSNGYHIYANTYIGPYGEPYSEHAINYNIISVFSTAMKTAGFRGDMPNQEKGGESLPIPFFGHRNQSGKVDKYKTYASALTCGLICTQNMKTNAEEMEKYAQYMLSRLCIIKSKETYFGSGEQIPYSLRVFSGSDFDLAFGIIPAKTGKNPSDFVVQGNPDWSGDNSDIEVEF